MEVSPECPPEGLNGSCTETEMSAEDILDDSLYALQYVLSIIDTSQSSSSSATSSLRFAFQHQLYCVVRDRSVVDEEIRALLPRRVRALFSHTANTDTM
jgi:hypothetical protein